MELMKRWRAEPNRSRRVHRQNNRGRSLGAAVAIGAMVAVAMPLFSADAAVGGRRSIEVFTGSDLVLLNGYPSRARVRIVVMRRGVVVGYATKRTTRAGTIELNHGGAAAGDCFESPRTPNIRPGDRIRTRILSNGVRDSSVVRGVFIDNVEFGASSITVSGRVRLGTRPASVRPATDVLELRINKDTPWASTGRRDLRVDINDDVQADGTWTHTLNESAEDVAEAEGASETFLEWSNPAADELTVAEWGDPEPLEGCPPIETG